MHSPRGVGRGENQHQDCAQVPYLVTESPWGHPAWPEAACVSAEVAEAECWLFLVTLSVSSGQTFKPEFLPRGAWR